MAGGPEPSPILELWLCWTLVIRADDPFGMALFVETNVGIKLALESAVGLAEGFSTYVVIPPAESALLFFFLRKDVAFEAGLP